MKSPNKNQEVPNNFVNEATRITIDPDKPIVDETDKYADDPYAKALEEVLKDMEKEDSDEE